jgi:hypothetical protein
MTINIKLLKEKFEELDENLIEFLVLMKEEMTED